MPELFPIKEFVDVGNSPPNWDNKALEEKVFSQHSLNKRSNPEFPEEH